MNDVLTKLIESLNNGNIFISLIIVIVAIIFNCRAIVDFFEERNKGRLAKLTEALQCEHLSEFSKIHLQEELATEHFKRSTGIRAEKQFRDAIIKTHQNCKGELRFVHFKRAVPYLYFENGELTIKITKFEKISFIYNLLAASLCAFLGLFLFVITGFNLEGSHAVVKPFGLSLFMCVLAVLLFFETVPVFSARHVRKELEKEIPK